MSFVPEISRVVPLVGANLATFALPLIALECFEDSDLKDVTQDVIERIFICCNAVLAGCTALAVIGSGGAGYAAFGLFTAAGALTLGKIYEGDNFLLKNWSDLAKKYEDGISCVSSIVNLSGGVYSLIALPFSFMNLGGTLSAAFVTYMFVRSQCQE
ncbi:MAG: hypothetical protein WC222_02290 [Parachlamydiales bacterium]|jgi:hypothetical protein